jgi:hypothetical protein
MGILVKNSQFYQSHEHEQRFRLRHWLRRHLQSSDEEVDRLQRVRSLLIGHTVPLKRGFPPSEHNSPTRKRRISAEGLTNIKAARKAGWVKTKRT